MNDDFYSVLFTVSSSSSSSSSSYRFTQYFISQMCIFTRFINLDASSLPLLPTYVTGYMLKLLHSPRWLEQEQLNTSTAGLEPRQMPDMQNNSCQWILPKRNEEGIYPNKEWRNHPYLFFSFNFISFDSNIL